MVLVAFAKLTLPLTVPGVPRVRPFAPWIAKDPPMVALLETLRPTPAPLSVSCPAMLLPAVPATDKIPVVEMPPVPTASVPLVSVPVTAALLFTTKAVPAALKVVTPLSVLALAPVWV